MDPLDWIARLDEGYFVENLDAEIQEVSAAVLTRAARHGAQNVKGKVVVTFNITHVTGGDPTVVVTPTFSHTVPKRDAGGLQLFLWDGAFHTNDPRQVPMQARVVETPAVAPRPVPGQPAPAREVPTE